jgi:hypothetical protein
MGLSMHERKPITQEFAVPYQAAQIKPEKSRILTEFTTLIPYNQKKAGL